jgi:hypothetical protein
MNNWLPDRNSQYIIPFSSTLSKSQERLVETFDIKSQLDDNTPAALERACFRYFQSAFNLDTKASTVLLAHIETSFE